jgi:hypothetical protein
VVLGPVASMVRQLSLREKFAIDIADGQNDALVLAVMLAVEAIHDRRRQLTTGGASAGDGAARPGATSPAAGWVSRTRPSGAGVTAAGRAAAVRGPDPGHPG